ncbi:MULTISPECIES: HAMP domain-containing sensor histidine kinase [Bacillus]|uniref:histidine kinase n=2 Tax=Bacillus TaxID=1386 RepID=A0A0M5JLZ9_9BACI|nr:MULTISPECIES: HAMP domain-containing sensor histidine kinase [Bacillus]ALC82327.1 histidine kinase [Bacillus gobiensis]MBP1081193.1 signal transduction histidine kinase [Bacillus capparidis]MED1095874.1 HAMP domain-containing sensor histidine kinase [Bacillus capparidis]
MKLRTKLVFLIIGQVFLMLVVVGFVLAFATTRFVLDIIENDTRSGLTRATPESFEMWIEKDQEESFHVTPVLKEIVDKEEGFLVLLNKNQEIVYSYGKKGNLPKTISNEDLNTIYQKEKLNGAKIYYWSASISDNEYIVLYGKEPKSEFILNYIKEHEKSRTSLDSFDPSTLVYIKDLKGSVYLFDQNGKYIDDINGSANLKKGIREIDLLSYTSKPWNYKNEISYETLDNGSVMVTAVPNLSYFPDDDFNRILSFSALKNFLIIICFLFFVIVLFALWYSFRFGAPIFHTIRWVYNLAKGNFYEPLNRKGRPVSKKKNGKVKQPYRLFNEVIVSLEKLTATLETNEKNRNKIQTTREEWIAGLSHDLKTPLSTIYGNAMMLESDQYEWSKDEVREMGQVMREKSEYMSELIEDLNLTYRLKNDAIPVDREKTDLVFFLKELIEHYERTPFLDEFYLHFHHNKEKVVFSIDQAWFKRIIDNLVANGVKHNDLGTRISVILHEDMDDITLIIKDNGKGMSQEHVANLFNRYYKGTNTKDPSVGSGLGLAITKELVHIHNGTINVESKEGAGTSIIMQFNKNK